MIGVNFARVMRAWPFFVFVVLMIGASPAIANRFTSPSYVIDASTMNTFGGSTSSSNYRLVSSGGEAIIGNGTGGSYKLGQGYVAQLESASPNIQVAVQPSGLHSYYPMDETSGDIVYDSGATSINGATVNGPTRVAGKIGSSLNFDGTNDYVNLGTPDVAGSAMTISAWVRADAFVNDPRIISKATGQLAADHYWSLNTSSTGFLRFRLKTGTTTTTLQSATGALTTNTWHYVAATYDGSNMRIYNNGVEVASVSKTGAIAQSNTTQAWIGANPTDIYRPWDGLIDELKIFSRAMTVDEIKAEYEAGKVGIPAGLGLGSVIAGTSRQANFDTVVRATTFSGYNLAVSQNNNLSSPATVTKDFNQDYNSFTSGTTLTAGSTGFANYSASGGATYTANNTSPIYGVFGRLQSTATSTAILRADQTLVADRYYRYYGRLSSLPSANMQIFSSRNSGTILGGARVQTDGKIRLINGTITVATSTAEITTGQWFRIEYFYNSSSSTQTLRLYFGNSVNSTTPTETITGPATEGSADSFLIGLINGEPNITYDIDEIASSTVDWIGSANVSTIAAVPSGTIATPAAWSEGTTKGLGFSVISAPGLDGKWGAGANYAALPGSSTSFYTRSGSLTNQIDTVALRARVDVPTLQAAGEYKNTITIVGTTIP